MTSRYPTAAADEPTARQTREDGKCVVVVEIPRGSRNKYEQADNGAIWFDRRLGGPAGFPGDYGYVPGVEGEDQDALDALVLIDEATFPGVHVLCRVIGSFKLQVGDLRETKLLCVPDEDHHADHVRDLVDLPEPFLDELGAFFHAYRMLESEQVEVVERVDRSDTLSRLKDPT